MPPGVFLSINEAATEFGNARRTITKRIANLGIRPAGSRQGYSVYRLRDLLEIERRNDDGAKDPEKLNPFDRHAHYKAESEKNKVNRERGELITREAHEREGARRLKVVAQELDTVVDEIERDVGADPIVLEKIEQKIDTIRERMYEGIVNPQEDDEDQGDVDPESDVTHEPGAAA